MTNSGHVADIARILETAYDMHKVGRNDSARQKFEEARDLDPDHPGAWRGLLHVAASQDDVAEAFRLLDSVRAKFGAVPWADLIESRMLASGGRQNETIQILRDKFVASDRRDADSFRMLIQLYSSRQDWAAVLSLFEGASQVAAESSSLRNVAHAYEATGSFDRALAIYRDCARRNDEAGWWLLGMSRCSLAIGDVEGAIQEAKAAVDLTNDLECHNQLALAHIEAGTGSELRDHYRDQALAEPGSVVAVTMWRTLSSWLSDWAAVVQIAESQPDFANEPSLVLECAYAHLWQENFDQAVELFQRVATRWPRYNGVVDGLVDAALALMGAGRTPEAEKLFAAALQYQPSNQVAYSGLVRSAFYQGDWRKIVALHQQRPPNLNLDEECSQAFAYAFELTGLFDEGLVAYKSALAHDPSAGWALLGAARCATGKSKYQEAIHFAHRAIDIENSVASHEQLAAVHLAAGTCRSLRDQYAKQWEETPDDLLQLTMARRLSSWVEDWPAVVSFARQTPGFSSNAEILVEVGYAYLWQSKYSEACETFESARVADPASIAGLAGLMRVAFSRFEITKSADLAMQLWDTQPTLEHLDYISICLLEASRHREARAVLADARRLFEAESEKDAVLEFVEISQLVTQYEFDQAFEILDRLAETHPSPYVTQNAIALSVEFASRSQAHPERLRESVAALEKHVLPLSLEAQLKLVVGYIALGRHRDASDQLDTLPEEQRSRHYIRRYLAWQATYRGDHDLASELGRLCFDAHYVPQLHAPIHNLELVREPVEIVDDMVVVFSACRDEVLRIPAFLKHHRQLGVKAFVVIDNGSTDGTYEFLLTQPDVILYRTDDDYVDAGLGMRWINHLIGELDTVNWCLFLDADELLIFPKCEELGVNHLAKYLDRMGHTAVGSFMLDMHPASLNAQSGLDSGDDLITHSPFFTNAYDFQPFPLSPYIDVRGGFRPMVLGERYRQMTKCPFVKSDAGVRFLSSSHETTSSVISDVRTALLHFKFVGDALTRSQNEVEWTDYVYYTERNKVLERLRDQQEREGDVDFMTDRTVRYENSDQLLRLGLISAPPAYFEHS